MVDDHVDRIDTITASPLDGMDGESPGPTGERDVPRRSAGGSYKAQMTRTNIILVLLFIGGAGMVYGLSLRKGPASASAQQQLIESNVDSAIDRLKHGGGRAPAAQRVTRDLLGDFSQKIVRWQVPMDQLAKNPFVFISPAPQPDAPSVKAAALRKRPEKTPEQLTLEQVMVRFKKLRLQSVMMGSGDGDGVAIISNNLLTVGQQIEGFTISRIDPKAVVLTWRDRQFVLKMSTSGE